MACVILRDSKGGERKVPEHTPFVQAPDEVFAGIDWTCAPEKAAYNPKPVNILAQEIGPGLGDMVKAWASPIARLLGKDKCAACEARRLVLNAYAKMKERHGMVKALRLLATVPTNDVDAAAEKIRELLEWPSDQPT